jgi:hypothetical protein
LWHHHPKETQFLEKLARYTHDNQALLKGIFGQERWKNPEDNRRFINIMSGTFQGCHGLLTVDGWWSKDQKVLAQIRSTVHQFINSGTANFNSINNNEQSFVSLLSHSFWKSDPLVLPQLRKFIIQTQYETDLISSIGLRWHNEHGYQLLKYALTNGQSRRIDISVARSIHKVYWSNYPDLILLLIRNYAEAEDKSLSFWKRAMSLIVPPPLEIQINSLLAAKHWENNPGLNSIVGKDKLLFKTLLKAYRKGRLSEYLNTERSDSGPLPNECANTLKSKL